MQFDPKGPPPETPPVRARVPKMLAWTGVVLFIVSGLVVGGQAMPEWFGWAKNLNPISLTQALLPFTLTPGSTSADAPDWGNQERVNVLVMGVDRRPDETMDSTVRTDVMEIISIDPYTKSASMLGIPRDLWVPIPLGNNQVTYERVNAANVVGVLRKHPGGGAALAKETVQYNLGVRINYYLMLDFDGFRSLIDTLGGVDIHVEKTLIDNQYPTDYYGTQRVVIEAGDQRMNGEVALQYARSRHADSDFGRMKRQQQVMLAVRERLLRLDMLPKLPQLWGQFHDAIRTDMGLGDALNLAKVAREVNTDNIVGKTLEYPYVTSYTAQDGAALLLPVRDKIRELVDEVFFDARKEGEARIEVLNGTSSPGLAAQTASALKNQGFENVVVGDAPGGPYKQTQVVNYSGKGYTAGLVALALKLPRDRVKAEKAPTGAQAPADPVDIRIILGQDLAN